MTQEKKVALVTGARSGVGLELTRRLLKDGWEVAALVRTPITGDDNIARADAGGRLRYYLADLADFADLRRVVSEIEARERAIDVLFNNAGVSPETMLMSPQGRELCFEVNTVVPYILLRALAPRLAAGRLKRIVNTSSNALLRVKSFAPSGLAHPKDYRKLFGPYAQSKLALSLWTKAVSGDFAEQGISVVSACPGPNKTPMTAGSGMPWALKMLAKVLFKHPRVGAQELYDALDPAHVPAGGFLMNGKVMPLPFPDQAAAVLAAVDTIFQTEFEADYLGSNQRAPREE